LPPDKFSRRHVTFFMLKLAGQSNDSHFFWKDSALVEAIVLQLYLILLQGLLPRTSASSSKPRKG
jgi:hypothetical protein